MATRATTVAGVSLACLVGLGLSNPISPPEERMRQLGLHKPLKPVFRGLELWERSNVTNGCEFLLDDGDEETRRAIWDSDGLGAGQFLDDWLTANGEDDWLNRMDEDLYTEGTESNLRCTTFDGTDCEGPTPDECQKYQDKNIPQWYWIVRSAVTHFGMMNAMYSAYQTETIMNTLKIDTIADDFGNEGQDSFDAWGFVSAAAIFASAIPGPQAAGFTVLIGAINMGKSFNAGTEVPSNSDISEALLSAFKSAMSGVQAAVDLAHTGSSPDNSDLSTADLASNGGVYANAVSNYFDGGRFLISDQSGAIQPTIDSFTQYSRQAMVNTVLQKRNFFVILDGGVTQEDCESAGNAKAWINDGVQDICADLYHFEHDASDANSLACNGGSNDEVDKMETEDYGSFDWTVMYENAVQCARDHPDGDGVPDPEAVPADGVTAPCFYNYGVLKTTDLSYCAAGNWQPNLNEDDPINTTGRTRQESSC